MARSTSFTVEQERYRGQSRVSPSFPLSGELVRESRVELAPVAVEQGHVEQRDALVHGDERDVDVTQNIEVRRVTVHLMTKRRVSVYIK